MSGGDRGWGVKYVWCCGHVQPVCYCETQSGVMVTATGSPSITDLGPVEREEKKEREFYQQHPALHIYPFLFPPPPHACLQQYLSSRFSLHSYYRSPPYILYVPHPPIHSAFLFVSPILGLPALAMPAQRGDTAEPKQQQQQSPKSNTH